MRLARKRNIALILGIIAVMAVYAYIQLRQEVRLDEAERQRARHVALAWLGALEAVWDSDGAARAAMLVERGNQRAEGVTVRLVSLDADVDHLPRADLTAAEIELLRKGEVVRRTFDDQAGFGWRHFYAALRQSPSSTAAVEFIEPLQGQQTFVQMSRGAMGLATLAVVLVSALIVSYVDLWFVARPLDRLRDKARRAGKGDFSSPLVLKQHDEIAELADEFNAMCSRLAEAGERVRAETEGRLAALEQMRHSDRLATVGQLAAGVAHELGTPLNVVSARAQLITSVALQRPDVVKNAEIIIEQSDRMTAIIQQLLDFSRRRAVKTERTDLRQLAARTIDLLSSTAAKAAVYIDASLDPAAVDADVDATQMQQALANILLNGIQSMPGGGRLKVAVGRRTATPPTATAAAAIDCACISVDDSGGGITTEQLSRIFEPFYTTKAVGQGTGLGLAVAHGIVTEHGGWIEVESNVGQGSRFSILLPPASVKRNEVRL